jgi:hypothetical protein
LALRSRRGQRDAEIEVGGPSEPTVGRGCRSRPVTRRRMLPAKPWGPSRHDRRPIPEIVTSSQYPPDGLVFRHGLDLGQHQCLDLAATLACVGRSNSARSSTATPNTCSILDAVRIASRECPPRAKIVAEADRSPSEQLFANGCDLTSSLGDRRLRGCGWLRRPPHLWWRGSTRVTSLVVSTRCALAS